MKNLAKFILEAKSTADFSGIFKNIPTRNAIVSIIDYLEEKIGETISAGVTINNDENLGEFADKAVISCIPHIVEAAVYKWISDVINKEVEDGITVGKIKQSDFKNDNKTYDISIDINNGLKDVKIEVKAFKDGKKDSITLTDAQRKNSSDVIFIYIDYSVDGTKGKINDILIGRGADISHATDAGDIISRHGGKTSNMVSLNKNLDEQSNAIIKKLLNNEQLTSKEKAIFDKKLKFKQIAKEGTDILYCGYDTKTFIVAAKRPFNDISIDIAGLDISEFKPILSISKNGGDLLKEYIEAAKTINVSARINTHYGDAMITPEGMYAQSSKDIASEYNVECDYLSYDEIKDFENSDEQKFIIFQRK